MSEIPFNMFCIDCKENRTTHAIIWLGAFVCKNCSADLLKAVGGNQHCYIKDMYNEHWDDFYFAYVFLIIFHTMLCKHTICLQNSWLYKMMVSPHCLSAVHMHHLPTVHKQYQQFRYFRLCVNKHNIFHSFFHSFFHSGITVTNVE